MPSRSPARYIGIANIMCYFFAKRRIPTKADLTPAALNQLYGLPAATET